MDVPVTSESAPDGPNRFDAHYALAGEFRDVNHMNALLHTSNVHLTNKVTRLTAKLLAERESKSRLQSNLTEAHGRLDTYDAIMFQLRHFRFTCVTFGSVLVTLAALMTMEALRSLIATRVSLLDHFKTFSGWYFFITDIVVVSVLMFIGAYTIGRALKLAR